jgi:hypothetical protein
MDVKQAVSKAMQYVQDLYGGRAPSPVQSGKAPLTLRLEEVELSDDEKYWSITVSFDQPIVPANPLQEAMGPSSERVYKTVKIKASSGRAMSMTIRNP